MTKIPQAIQQQCDSDNKAKTVVDAIFEKINYFFFQQISVNLMIKLWHEN